MNRRTLLTLLLAVLVALALTGCSEKTDPAPLETAAPTVPAVTVPPAETPAPVTTPSPTATDNAQATPGTDPVR